MKESGVDVLVYHAVGNNPDSCRRLNDRTPQLCRDYSDRLVGLATVPLPFPQEAEAEADRAILVAPDG
jgi:predicted TIM-barrel fold metal-dependent hydrolase